MLADQPGRGRLQPVQIERPHPAEGVVAAQRLGAPGRVRHPVLVPPERRREPRVECRRHRRHGPHPRIGRHAARPAGAAASRPGPSQRRRAGRCGRPGRSRAPRRRCARPRSGPAARPRRRAGRAPRRAPRRRCAGRLRRPAGEVGAVVGHVQPQPDARHPRSEPKPTARTTTVSPVRAVTWLPYRKEAGPAPHRVPGSARLVVSSPSALSPGPSAPLSPDALTGGSESWSSAASGDGRSLVLAGSASTLSCWAAALRAGLLGRRRVRRPAAPRPAR